MAVKRVANTSRARAPLSVSAKAGPSGEVKKVRDRATRNSLARRDAPGDGAERPHPAHATGAQRTLKPCSPRFVGPSPPQNRRRFVVAGPDPPVPPRSSPKQVVLAYSGGLDTSIILKWLQDTYGCEVITFTADLGQGEELEPARAKAEQMGVKQVGTVYPHVQPIPYRYNCVFRISRVFHNF